MRFQVPQFIGIEDKIFGPFTAKQFVYLAGGAGLCYIIYRYLPLFAAIIVIAPILALTVSLAFIKVNNKPFIFTLEAAIKYFLGSKLYLWRKETNKKQMATKKSEDDNGSENFNFAPTISESKLKEINLALDIKNDVDNKAS